MGLFDEENRKTEQALVKKARTMARRDKRTFYMNASILGVFGWQMAVPVLLGVILGRFLDRNAAMAHFSWTLNLIVIGFALGWVNAMRWIKKEGIVAKKKKGKQK